MNTTTIGVDIAKSVFQVSIANRVGRIIDRKRLSRTQFQRFLAEQPNAALVMEACATSHHWARTAQSHGHHTRFRSAELAIAQAAGDVPANLRQFEQWQ